MAYHKRPPPSPPRVPAGGMPSDPSFWIDADLAILGMVWSLITGGDDRSSTVQLMKDVYPTFGSGWDAVAWSPEQYPWPGGY